MVAPKDFVSLSQYQGDCMCMLRFTYTLRSKWREEHTNLEEKTDRKKYVIVTYGERKKKGLIES